MSIKTRLKKDSLILSDKIPKTGTNTVALIEYEGYCAIVTVKSIEDGSYRDEFLKQTGVPLPINMEIPSNPPEKFCPNLSVTKEIKI